MPSRCTLASVVLFGSIAFGTNLCWVWPDRNAMPAFPVCFLTGLLCVLTGAIYHSSWASSPETQRRYLLVDIASVALYVVVHLLSVPVSCWTPAIYVMLLAVGMVMFARYVAVTRGNDHYLHSPSTSATHITGALAMVVLSQTVCRS